MDKQALVKVHNFLNFWQKKIIKNWERLLLLNREDWQLFRLLAELLNKWIIKLDVKWHIKWDMNWSNLSKVISNLWLMVSFLNKWVLIPYFYHMELLLLMKLMREKWTQIYWSGFYQGWSWWDTKCHWKTNAAH